MALALGLSACGGSSSPSGSSTASTSSTSSTSSTVSTPSASPAPSAADTIVIKNFAFQPASLTVLAGATVTVHNEDDSTHTVTADDGRFDTGDIGPGQTVSLQIHGTGSFSYHCSIHQFMHGSLTVKG
ncbi:MAG TPA: cupredoxin domain-containing protein [Acidimicrobiales bacterium]|nr:cupredoxin domain-containing protein [Acidimicrobiales bacterium]